MTEPFDVGLPLNTCLSGETVNVYYRYTCRTGSPSPSAAVAFALYDSATCPDSSVPSSIAIFVDYYPTNTCLFNNTVYTCASATSIRVGTYSGAGCTGDLTVSNDDVTYNFETAAGPGLTPGCVNRNYNSSSYFPYSALTICLGPYTPFTGSWANVTPALPTPSAAPGYLRNEFFFDDPT